MKSRALITPYFVTHRWTIAVGLMALIVVDILQLMIPRVVKWAVDDLTSMQVDVKGLAGHAAAIAAMAVFIGLFRYIWRRCLLGTARLLEADLRNRLLAHLQTLSTPFFDRTKTGELMAHATNDIMQIRMACGMGLVALNDAIVLGLAAVGFMLYINVQLTLYVLIPMPFIVFGTRLLSRSMHRRYQGVQAAFADLTEVVRERCAGIHIIKAHNEEPIARSAVHNASQAYVDQNMRLVAITGSFFPLMMMFTNLSLAAVLYFGGRKTILAETTPGDFVAFISYLNLLSWPMMALGWVTNLIQRGGASLDRLNTVFQQMPEIRSPSKPRSLPELQGSITFEHVSFGYDKIKSGNVLTDIDLMIPPGGMLGVAGPPGSGKSTLLSMIPRLYDPNAGRITIGGIDLRTLDPADLRRRIACVPQEPFLFSGTVRDNILFGCPDRCLARLDEAIAQAGLAETVLQFPKGLDSVVGEKGILLSGGQRQRVALARALLINAPIVLLDDPISQVDANTAAEIIETIRHMAGRKTVVVASHRLAAIRFADTIISLAKGRITEKGNHRQLLAANGYYARVHALQELDDAI